MNWKKKTGSLLGSIIFVAVMSFLFTFTACGKTPESTACVHEWGEYTVIKDATCTEKGIKERQCAKCGETEKEEIAALGHTEVADETIEPTALRRAKQKESIVRFAGEIIVAQEEIAAARTHGSCGRRGGAYLRRDRQDCGKTLLGVRRDHCSAGGNRCARTHLCE